MTDTRQLRPSQDSAVRRMVASSTLLLADMGWGKTAATLRALRVLRLMGVSPTVVVAPPKVAIDQAVWQTECQAWTPELTTQLVHAGKGADVPADIYVCSWDSVHTEAVQEVLARAQVLVLDEASFAKNWTRRVKSLKKHTFQFVHELTGTPTPNGLLDLFYPVQLADRGLRFGLNKETFKKQYFYPEDYNGYRWEPRSEQAIYDKLEGLVFRGENIDLPPVQVQPLEIPMSAEQTRVYRELEKDYVALVESGEVTAANAAVLANKLRQCAAGFLIDTETGTVNWLSTARTDTIAETMAALNSPAIVLYEYQAQRDALLAAGLGLELLSGDTVKRWNRGELPGVLMHAKSGGHGLNLQFGGHHAIWSSLTWSWELWSQANARLARPGQASDTVFAHVCQAPGTVEGHVYDVLVGKGESELRLLDWAASLTARSKAS